MRKQNSTFKTAFISEAGSELENNDYFAFVELEQYACYVIADGLNELSDARSARLAIESVLLAFQENPSIKKRVVFSYLKAADKALREADSRERLKASVTVIVTDYANILYGYAGNTRLFLYRDGNMKEQTQDMSLGNDLKKEKKLPDDVLARHEERNNLYTYIGQGNGFAPYVSKKIKLVNGDILALYTRGIWENLDGGELNDVFSEAKGEPQESLDCIEDLLLSRQPKELGNYTFAAIYVDKVFLDPNQKKRIKKMITVATAILTLVLVGSLILLIFYRQRQSQIENMEQKYFNTIEYIQDNNYLRAKIECEEALKAAEKLKDKKRIREIYDYQKLIEAVNAADSAYSNKKYEEAQSGYATAKERSRYADRIADEYINKQLGMITDYRSVFDYIQLGDTLAAQGDYARAEEKYLQAKSLATRAYFEEGRKEAMEVLEAMYARREEAEEADTQEAKAKASDETGAAQLASQGDKAFSEGDYEGAKAYYAMALEKYQQLGDVVHGELVQTRIASSEQKSTEIKEKEQQAEEYIKAGREQEMTGDKLDAKKQYLLAKNIYKELKMDNKVTEIEGLLELLDVAAMQENIKKENKMSEENNNKKEGLSSGEDSDAIKEEGQEIGPGI